MDVKLPPLGEGADSGTIITVLVSEGDQIEKGQSLVELETGKAVAPIPSPAAGKVAKIHVQEGGKLTVGQLILTLEAAEKAEAEPPKKPAPAKAPAARTAAPAKEESEEIEEEETTPEEPEEEAPEGALPPPASPSIRRMARELGIDLRRIRGSERGGRIVMADLRGYVQRLQKQAAKSKAAPAKAEPKPAAEQIDFSKWGQIAKRPMSNLRKVIAQRMSENWNAIPHVTQFDNVDITDLMELRKKYAPEFEKKGARLTLTGFALKALVATLKKHPIFNSSLDEVAHEIVTKEYYHIGIAVDTDQGLIVPVIRDVDKKDLLTLSKELNELAEKTRNRKVSMEDLQGGTFTISNQGAIGGAHFTPIINKPEVAILGMGKGALTPVVRDHKVEARLILPITLSYDHRVIDGASAARFMVDFVRELEGAGEKWSDGVME